MGRLSACLLLLLGACGDNVGVEGLGAGPSEDIETGGTADNVPRYVPQVCGVSSWSPTVTDPALDLSVAQRPGGGATLLNVPRSGGTLTGFNVDPRMNMEGADLTKVATDWAFEQITVSYVENRPISTGVAAGALYLHVLGEALEDPQYITKLPANAVAEPAFYRAQGNIVMPVVTDNGLWMHRFDDSLEPLDSKHFATSGPGRSLTVAQLGTAMITAWSTDTSCHLVANSTYEPGMQASVNKPCANPRLSINQTNGEGVMLFDSAEGVRLMPIHTTMMGGDASVIRPGANSPRTVFDGTNHWVSYLDSRGDVVVGFLDVNRKPVTMSLGAPTPERTGFELVMVDGAPWVFSVDAGGYTAYRMCVEAQY